MFMGMFRMAIVVLAIFLIGSLIFNALGGAGAAAAGALGLLLLIPLLFLKIVLLFVFFGFIGRAFWGGRRPWGGYRPTWTRGRSPQTERRSEKDRFEEWHDLAHAREEVDSWVPDLTGDNNVIDENGPGS